MRDLVCSLIDDNKSTILVLTKTWPNPDVTDDQIPPPTKSYNIYRKDRSGKTGGGVLRHEEILTFLCYRLKLISRNCIGSSNNKYNQTNR